MILYLHLIRHLIMNKLLKIYILLFFLFADFIMFAQPTDEDDNGDLEGNDPEPAPINGKIVLLLIIGLTFAYYKLRKSSKEA